jgi:hypothetical protein
MELVAPFFGQIVKVKITDNRIIEGDFQVLLLTHILILYLFLLNIL